MSKTDGNRYTRVLGWLETTMHATSSSTDFIIVIRFVYERTSARERARGTEGQIKGGGGWRDRRKHSGIHTKCTSTFIV